MENTKLTYCYKYPHPALTTDCVIFGYEDRMLKVLLIERGNDPYKGCWAFPGGFVKIDETVEDGAKRELFEETGLDNCFIEQFKVFSKVDRDPRERVITVAFYALVRISEVHGGDDAADAKWFPIDNMPTLAFDHAEMFQEALAQLKRDIYFKPIGFDLLPEQFTMPQLQNLYETILGINFDRRNFYKKMLATGILAPDERESEPRTEYKKTSTQRVPSSRPEQKLMANLGSHFFSLEDFLRDKEVDDNTNVPGISFTKDTATEGLFDSFGAVEHSTAVNPIPNYSPNSIPQRSSTRGRTPNLFHFVKEKYDEMKEKGFKFEF